MRIFSVVSWGAAGSGWLARALNSHPDILCLHAGDLTFSQHFGVQRLGGSAYTHALGVLGDLYPVVGDVHGIAPEDIPALKEQLDDQFRCAVLVREPRARVRSMMAVYRRDNFQGVGDLSFLDYSAGLAGYDFASLSPEQQCALYAAQMPNRIEDEVQLGPIFRMEDVTANPRSLAELAAYLSGGAIMPGVGWARRAIAIRAINVRSREARDEPLADFMDEAMRRLITPAAWQAYADLGYSTPMSEGPGKQYPGSSRQLDSREPCE